jgi:hypothetical protein
MVVTACSILYNSALASLLKQAIGGLSRRLFSR